MEWRKESIRDEAGEGFDTVTCQEIVMPLKFLDMHPDSRLKSIRDFKYLDGDILICSYPKTGSHWVFNIVHFLTNPGPVEEMLTVSPKMIDLAPLQFVEEQIPPRAILSHFHPCRQPREHLEKRGKIILLARNPRDTMVSLFHHHQKHELFSFSNMSWPAFFENWINGKVPTGSYFGYYGAWKKFIEENNPNILVVHYESLIQNGVQELRRIQDFLHVSNSNERLKQILDRCSLVNLRHDVDSGKVQSPLKDQSGKAIIYRKGEVGDWKNHFTIAQSDAFDLVEEKYKDIIFKH